MQRERNFTDTEKNYLLDLIFIYRNIIENKVTDRLTTSKKDEAWAVITQEYNKNIADINKRAEKPLRYCWDNLKRNTRKYCAAFKREMYKTGGGVINVRTNPLYERVREIMGETAVHGLLNPFDSDAIDNNTHNKEINTNKELINTENKENVVHEILETDDENDSNEVFSYLMKNKEVTQIAR